MISSLLACNRFDGRHTSHNAFLNFQKAIKKFNFNWKLNFIISDNASNMVAAFSLPEFENLEPHLRSTVQGSEVENNKEDDDEDVLVSQQGDCYSVYDYLPTHERCFAHSLQLVIKHGLEVNASISSILRKIKKLVSHIRK